MRRLILDVDTGVDDALAILFALRSPQLSVEAITTVAGNVPVEVATRNTLVVLQVAGRGDIPVAAGAARPLIREPAWAKGVHGANGLGGVTLPPVRLELARERAVDLMLSRLRATPGEITLIQTGPLTNLAQALLREPRIAEWAREIIIMGGAFSCSGNVTPRAEFNIHFDPEAARAVLHSGARIVLVGLDVTHQVLLRPEHVEMLAAAGGEVPRFAAAISRGFLETHRSLGWEGAPLHDPLAVGVAAFPDLVGSQALAVDVETRGELTLGETVVDMRLSRSTQPNAHVCLMVEAQRFLEVFLQALKG